MKTFFILFFFLLALNLSGQTAIGDTTLRGTTYTVWEGKQGGHYIIRTSRTGNEYKQYFPRVAPAIPARQVPDTNKVPSKVVAKIDLK